MPPTPARIDGGPSAGVGEQSNPPPSDRAATQPPARIDGGPSAGVGEQSNPPPSDRAATRTVSVYHKPRHCCLCNKFIGSFFAHVYSKHRGQEHLVFTNPVYCPLEGCNSVLERGDVNKSNYAHIYGHMRTVHPDVKVGEKHKKPLSSFDYVQVPREHAKSQQAAARVGDNAESGPLLASAPVDESNFNANAPDVIDDSPSNAPDVIDDSLSRGAEAGLAGGDMVLGFFRSALAPADLVCPYCCANLKSCSFVDHLTLHHEEELGIADRALRRQKAKDVHRECLETKLSLPNAIRLSKIRAGVAGNPLNGEQWLQFAKFLGINVVRDCEWQEHSNLFRKRPSISHPSSRDAEVSDSEADTSCTSTDDDSSGLELTDDDDDEDHPEDRVVCQDLVNKPDSPRKQSQCKKIAYLRTKNNLAGHLPLTPDGEQQSYLTTFQSKLKFKKLMACDETVRMVDHLLAFLFVRGGGDVNQKQIVDCKTLLTEEGVTEYYRRLSDIENDPNYPVGLLPTSLKNEYQAFQHFLNEMKTLLASLECYQVLQDFIQATIKINQKACTDHKRAVVSKRVAEADSNIKFYRIDEAVTNDAIELRLKEIRAKYKHQKCDDPNDWHFFTNYLITACTLLSVNRPCVIYNAKLNELKAAKSFEIQGKLFHIFMVRDPETARILPAFVCLPDQVIHDVHRYRRNFRSQHSESPRLFIRMNGEEFSNFSNVICEFQKAHGLLRMTATEVRRSHDDQFGSEFEGKDGYSIVTAHSVQTSRTSFMSNHMEFAQKTYNKMWTWIFDQRAKHPRPSDSTGNRPSNSQPQKQTAYMTRARAEAEDEIPLAQLRADQDSEDETSTGTRAKRRRLEIVDSSHPSPPESTGSGSTTGMSVTDRRAQIDAIVYKKYPVRKSVKAPSKQQVRDLLSQNSSVAEYLATLNEKEQSKVINYSVGRWHGRQVTKRASFLKEKYPDLRNKDARIIKNFIDSKKKYQSWSGKKLAQCITKINKKSRCHPWSDSE